MNPFSVNLTGIEMLQTGIALVIIVSGIFAVFYSIWGGFLLITSGGNEEKVKPAVNHIRHSILGLVVLLIVIFTAPKVLSLFGLPYADDLSPGSVFSKMKELSGNFFGNTSGVDSPSTNLPEDTELPSDFSDL